MQNNKGQTKGLSLHEHVQGGKGNLVELPPFETWFVITTVESQAIGEEVVGDMISLTIPPSILTTTY